MGLLDKLRLAKMKMAKDKHYSNYLDVQYKRSKLKLNQKSDKEPRRKEFLVSLLSSKVDLRKTREALVLGCRNAYELDLLENKGIGKTTGIDLFSNDKRVLVMDMHKLLFDDNSFDLIYCSHVLEHALEYKKVFKEISRIIKNDGILTIEVPSNIDTTGAEINDFESSDNLLKLLSEYIQNIDVIYKEDFAKGSEDNFCGSDGIRLIIRVKK